MRKINQLAKQRVDVREELFDLDYRKILGYFLNPDVGNKNMQEINQSYIQDKGMVKELEELPGESMDSIVALIGPQGIGKSMDIYYSYQIKNNAIRFDESNKAIIFPSFFNGFVHGNIEEEPQKIYVDIREELSKKIGAVCDELEMIYPDIAQYFYSDEGRHDFLTFFRNTNPQVLVDVNSRKPSTEKSKLLNAEENDYFVYAATRLKFYLANFVCEYNRLVIILDDVESMPEKYQKEIVSQYIRFYSCMRNYPSIGVEKDIYIKLLISICPNTYKRMKTSSDLPAGGVTKELYKTKRLDLVKYFENKYIQVSKMISDENRQVMETVYSDLIHLSSKFKNKYSFMIQELVDGDLRKTLKIYRQVLTNNTWVVKRKVNDQGGERRICVFNNITVIRALSCGSNVVYFNEKDNLIPNIIFDGKDVNVSILSLYIMAYFISLHSELLQYGEKTVKVSVICSDFVNVFGNKHIELKLLLSIIGYLLDIGIIRESKIKADDINTEMQVQDQSIYLSSKGWIIWKMLLSDSVLMELYREDFYLDENDEKRNNLSSSFELMEKNMQSIIFQQIYLMLFEFYKAEKEKIMTAINNGSFNKYKSLFGERLIVEHLMTGVDKSIEYSGNANNEYISPLSNELKRLIEELKFPETKYEK